MVLLPHHHEMGMARWHNPRIPIPLLSSFFYASLMFDSPLTSGTTFYFCNNILHQCFFFQHSLLIYPSLGDTLNPCATAATYSFCLAIFAHYYDVFIASASLLMALVWRTSFLPFSNNDAMAWPSYDLCYTVNLNMRYTIRVLPKGKLRPPIY